MNARLKTHWRLIVILALNVALSLAFSLVDPLYESTDELHNYRYIRYILATGKLPELDPNQPRIQAHHPPLYYLLGAAATFWIKPDSSWDYEPAWNPFWGFHDWQVGADNKNHYLHGAEEAFPTTGAPLAARVARWVNVILGALTVGVTYLTARRIFPESDALALGAAAIVAFNPQFLYLSGAVNNDVGAGLAGSAIVLACVDQAGRPLTLRRAALMGLLLGLALNTKFNLVFMLVVIAAWRERSSKKWLVANLVLLAVTLALSGWWFVRNQMLYGEPTAIRRTNELWGGRDPRQSWGAALLELPYAWSSLWGRFGYGQIPMPAWIYTAILIVTIAAALGLLIMFAKSILHRRDAEGAETSHGKNLCASVCRHVVRVYARQHRRADGALLFSSPACTGDLDDAGLEPVRVEATPSHSIGSGECGHVCAGVVCVARRPGAGLCPSRAADPAASRFYSQPAGCDVR
jgi:4-amino-4-deoxy-L-arabinose transferase-like glycosyltransferase